MPADILGQQIAIAERNVSHKNNTDINVSKRTKKQQRSTSIWLNTVAIPQAGSLSEWHTLVIAPSLSVMSTWASYQIRKIAGCACAGNAGNVFPRRRFQRELLVSDPGMHHGTCVTHVPWCMSGSLTCGDGENVPGIPGACAPAILRIWQEAHGATLVYP